MNKEQIRNAINYATSNKGALGKSDKAGCYYCLKVYPATEVTSFLEEENTALCPNCGIDSVLPDNSPYKLTIDNLRELKKIWF